MSSESGHKTPVKRVSFSATHSIINGDSGEQTVKHRDSIISASTDSSEDSNSSGETRASFRGKMRPRLPLTTETTRQLADMCNVSMDETPEAIYAEAPHRGTSSLSSSSSTAFARSDRRRASMQERRGSCGSGNSEGSQRLGHIGRSSMKQHSLDSGDSTLTRNRQHSPVSIEGQYTHVRRKSEPSVSDLISMNKDDPTYSPVYVPSINSDDNKGVNGSQYSRLGHQEPEPIYNQIRSAKTPPKQPAKAPNDTHSAIPPPPQFGTNGDDINHIAPPLPPPPPRMDHEPSPPLPPPPSHVQHMQVPPPPPPVSCQKTAMKPSPSVSQQQSHKQPGPTMQTSSPAPPASSQSHAKTPPPATLPKPTSGSSSSSSNNTPPVSNNINTPPFGNSNNTANNTRNSPFSNNMNASVTSHRSPSLANSNTHPPQSHSLPKQAPPPPPLRLSSNDSTCSSLSGLDSVTGSPLHVAMPPPMPPLNPKLPPPTLPKSASPRPGPPPPPPPGPPDAPVLSRFNNNQHSTAPTHPTVAAETCGGPPQSPSLPFLSELSKRSQPEPGQDSDVVNNHSGQPHPPNQQHRRSASSGGSGSIKSGQKAVPPPPPKRSENTRLSGEVAHKSHNTPPSPDPVANGSSAIHDPIYENYDGIMDIDELPPPPPELLMDFAPSESCEQRTTGSAKKAKPPPPPPKRSKETQLSSH